MIVVETYEGEKLIGRLVEGPQSGVTQVPGFGSDDGIWLQRKTKLSFIAHESVKVQRPATVFDREEFQPTY